MLPDSLFMGVKTISFTSKQYFNISLTFTIPTFEQEFFHQYISIHQDIFLNILYSCAGALMNIPLDHLLLSSYLNRPRTSVDESSIVTKKLCFVAILVDQHFYESLQVVIVVVLSTEKSVFYILHIWVGLGLTTGRGLYILFCMAPNHQFTHIGFTAGGVNPEESIPPQSRVYSFFYVSQNEHTH